jgi:hypothetical protein
MSAPRDAAEWLDSQLDRLQRDHLVVIELDDLRHLLVEPDVDPFATGHGCAGAGLDDVAATLCAAKTLPDELTVRVVIPTISEGTTTAPDVQSAFRRHAGYLATDVDSALSAGILIVVASLLITVAWVVSWLVIETTFVDWRPAARQAVVYELLARATLAVEGVSGSRPEQ